MDDLKNLVQQAKKNKEKNDSLSAEQKEAVEAVIQLLDCGKLRVCEFVEDQWLTHAWVKEAILLYFSLRPMEKYELGPYQYIDKIPLKQNYEELQVRVVPPATARYGSFMEPGVVLMPCYVNIGAYIGASSMVDTFATVGSCAQIGKGVHLSGGCGIGGVLEPAAAQPVVVEDGAFIGSRCIIVEGVRVGKEAVLAANVTLTGATPIIDTRQSPFKVLKGEIPARCVVLPGTRDKKLEGGTISTSCAYIVGERKESTDRKTSLNQALREFSVSV